MILLLTLVAWADPWVVAHRGGTGLGPENRLQTFAKALELGVDALELDIHQSSDGGLVVIHDLTLDRTFGVSGRVDRMTLKQLKALGVPTLQQVVDLVGGRAALVVEIKQPKDGTHHQGIEKRLIALLKKNDILESTVVISFYADSLKVLHKLEPALATGYLFGGTALRPNELKRELGVSYAGPHYKLATAEYIRECHQAGLKVSTWTVNDTGAMRALVSSGVDCITTNHPDQLLKLLRPEPAQTR